MFKKLLLFSASALLLEGVALAGNLPTVHGPDSKPFTFKPSSNVDMSYYVDATTKAQNYTINAKNQAGNRVYSSSNNTSNIYYQEDDAWKGKKLGDTGVAEETTAGQSSYDTAWKSN